MNYEGLREYVIKQGGDLNALADLGRFAPGIAPVKIRAVALMIHNTIAAAGVVKFDKRVTFGTDTGRGDGDVAIVNLATTHTGGKVVFKDGLDVLVKPGEEVVAEVTDVTGVGDLADVVVYYEPSYEIPANITAMVETT